MVAEGADWGAVDPEAGGREGMERAGSAAGADAGGGSGGDESFAGPGVVVVKGKEKIWSWNPGLVQLISQRQRDN